MMHNEVQIARKSRIVFLNALGAMTRSEFIAQGISRGKTLAMLAKCNRQIWQYGLHVQRRNMQGTPSMPDYTPEQCRTLMKQDVRFIRRNRRFKANAR